MDFRSMNKFNVIMNTLSGNFFPLSEEKTSLGFVRTVYVIFTWIIETIFLTSTFLGLFLYVPLIDALRDGAGLCILVAMESFILAPYLYSHNNNLRELVGKMNSILVDSDAFKKCMRESVDPHKNRLKVYIVGTSVAVILWGFLPIFKLLQRDRHSFNSTDFVVPTYYPGAPFSANGFFWGVIMETVGSIYGFIKKGSIDVYISYLITLLATEYHYVRHQLNDALRQINDEKNEKLVITLLRKCVHHHCVAMEAGKMLTELLALNVGLTYFNCVLRMCFVGMSVVTHPDMSQKLILFSYAMGILVQVYMFCLCGQELLEASTTITDDAFHENWYERGNSVKSIFRTVELGSRVQCRITGFGIIDLSVPTFKQILSHSYTAILLLLRVS